GRGPEPAADSALRRVRHDRTLAIDRAPNPGRPPRDAASAGAVLPTLAGRPGDRGVLELRLQPDRFAERTRLLDLLRPAAIPPLVTAPPERTALQALDTDACIRLAQDLVRVPSVTGNERAVQDLIALVLEEGGLEVDRFAADVSRLKAHPRFPGMEVERTEAVLVAGLLGEKGEGALIP